MRLSRHPDIELINQYPFAVKAHELAKLRGAETSMSGAKGILLAIVDDVLAKASDEPEGGTFLLTIRQYKRVGGDKKETRDRADLALERFQGDWHLRRELALFRASLEDDAELGNAIVRAELERLIAEADTREGLLKENLLREVLSTARAHGLRDIAGLASSNLAGLTSEDYELKAHEMSVRLAPDEAKQVRDTIQAIQEAATSEAWATWANITPEFLPREKRASYEFRIVDRIATLSEINRRGHVSFVAETDDQIIEYRNHQHDRQHYEILYSLLIGPGLEILLSRNDCKELLYRTLSKNPLLTDVGRGRLRAAFDVSASTDDFAVVGDSLPTLESMVRELAISAEVSIYNASGSANVFRTLGGLISDLTKLLEPGARLGRFWAFALTDQLGYNIRNDYLHGFSETLTRFEATIILQIYAQMMFLINYSMAAESAESNAAQSPRNSDAVPG